jgi:hypothetical protein
MSQVEEFATRLSATRERLHRLPASDSHDPGPPDPSTGERWDRFNVLGHTAEILPFWSREIGRALSSGSKLGREPGSMGRLEGIEGGRLLGETMPRERIDAGVDAALALLAALTDADLERQVETYAQGQVTVRHALETFVVGHFEAHVAQLEGLP